MDSRDLRISREVGGVQRQQIGYTMDDHGRDQARIVNLFSGNEIRLDQSVYVARLQRRAFASRHSFRLSQFIC